MVSLLVKWDARKYSFAVGGKNSENLSKSKTFEMNRSQPLFQNDRALIIILFDLK